MRTITMMKRLLGLALAIAALAGCGGVTAGGGAVVVVDGTVQATPSPWWTAQAAETPRAQASTMQTPTPVQWAATVQAAQAQAAQAQATAQAALEAQAAASYALAQATAEARQAEVRLAEMTATAEAARYTATAQADMWTATAWPTAVPLTATAEAVLLARAEVRATAAAYAPTATVQAAQAEAQAAHAVTWMAADALTRLFGALGLVGIGIGLVMLARREPVQDKSVPDMVQIKTTSGPNSYVIRRVVIPDEIDRQKLRSMLCDVLRGGAPLSRRVWVDARRLWSRPAFEQVMAWMEASGLAAYQNGDRSRGRSLTDRGRAFARAICGEEPPPHRPTHAGLPARAGDGGRVMAGAGGGGGDDA